jgi:predicted ArsR family transcriptional regulator
MKALSERLGLSPRQLQRYITELQKAGLVERVERRAAHQGRLSNEYDLSALSTSSKRWSQSSGRRKK